MKLQVGVKILLKTPDNKFLILNRNPKKYKNITNTWDIPGGRIDKGCDLITNLKRELMEETGIVLTKTPRVVAAQDIIMSGDKHVVRLTYIVNISKNSKPILSNEHIDYKWATTEEILKLDKLDTYLESVLNNLNKK